MNKKLMIKLGIGAALLIGIFIAWKQGLFGGAKSDAPIPDATDSLDTEYANKLVDYMTSKWGDAIAATTMGYATDSRFAQGANLGDYNVGGQWTKTGSIMAAFGSSVHSWAGGNGAPASQGDWQGMYNIWTEFKKKKLKQSL